ncbi:hypothetical protein AYJ00_07205 [Shewanella algae]|uniref:glycosyltransferase n=1 Tax=Shewanella algae TaxID=38313 RepID=UPI00118379A8|nr:glycosyltransferase [Shewanella algae]TVL51516.1 hypothetical protein AYJ00_07205 [Shewanella algae]
MKVVISGVNLVNGGPLQVFKDAIVAFSNRPDVHLVCLVNDMGLFTSLKRDNVQFIEFNKVKSSWLLRLKFEYFTCYKLSAVLDADIWMAMHDISPRVVTKNQFVYCHNPSPFYKSGFKDLWFDFKFFLFTNFYKSLYGININSNKAVIVQQSWIADFFKTEFNVNNVIVAKPGVGNTDVYSISSKQNIIGKGCLKLFYPSLSRTFKNFELLLEAVNIISKIRPDCYNNIELTLTLNPNGSRYEAFLYSKYKHLNNIDFVGMLTKEEVEEYYRQCSIVVFPSKLETWGLPITEAKALNKPILLSNLPYAKETLGNYNNACFFNPNDPLELAQKLLSIYDGHDIFYEVEFSESEKCCNSWKLLVDKILDISEEVKA